MLHIDGKIFRMMAIGAANNLEKNKKLIDTLNVFPVPDGDTGTNMALTVMTAVKGLENIKEGTVSEMADIFASGLLRGARGNSGVITSQLIRGFAKALKGKETASVEDIAEGMRLGVEIAYKAVMKPKEGTILTVARETSEEAQKIVKSSTDLEDFLTKCIAAANKSLDRTPELLPVLKQAGVVDSGGKGLVSLIEGAFFALKDGNENIEISVAQDGAQETFAKAEVQNIDTANIKFAYCTEFLIVGNNFSEQSAEDLKKYLKTIGDCVLVIGDEDVIKVHVHTNTPGNALNAAVKLGSLSKIKIENMKEQHSNIIFSNESENVTEEDDVTPEERKEFGVVSVSIGEGLNFIFKDLGVDCIISGGQTMNPSTEDILKAINSVNADTVYILPNNSNIILTANQAKAIANDKRIEVIPTKNVAQGISALVAFDANKNVEDNVSAMQEAIAEVKVGQITFAARDTSFEEKTIKKGDIMGIIDGKISVLSKELKAGAKETIDALVNEDTSVISIYYGADVSKDDADELLKYVEENYDYLDAEVYSGGQPLYYYIISAE